MPAPRPHRPARPPRAAAHCADIPAASHTHAAFERAFATAQVIRLETEKQQLLSEGQAKLDEMFNEACDSWEKTVKPSIERTIEKLRLKIGTPGEESAKQQIAACESLIEANERELYG